MQMAEEVLSKFNVPRRILENGPIGQTGAKNVIVDLVENIELDLVQVSDNNTEFYLSL